MKELSITTRVKINWTLEVISIMTLVLILAVWFISPSRLTMPSVNHESWFAGYLWIGSLAATMVCFNAVKNGLWMLPRLTPIKADQDYTREEFHFTIFSISSLLIIPVLVFPVLISLHYVLSDLSYLGPFSQLAM